MRLITDAIWWERNGHFDSSDELLTNESAAGFVYVLANLAMPGVLKIGRTSRNPLDRATELYTTGVPYPFQVCFAIYSSDATVFEENIHERLEEVRLNGSREFFRISVEDAVVHLCIEALSNSGHSVFIRDDE